MPVPVAEIKGPLSQHPKIWEPRLDGADRSAKERKVKTIQGGTHFKIRVSKGRISTPERVLILKFVNLLCLKIFLKLRH
jgi:hypothetical protein